MKPITDADVSRSASRWELPLEDVKKLAAKVVDQAGKYRYTDLPKALDSWCKREVLTRARTVPVTTSSLEEKLVGRPDPSHEYWSSYQYPSWDARYGFREGSTLEEVRQQVKREAAAAASWYEKDAK